MFLAMGPYLNSYCMYVNPKQKWYRKVFDQCPYMVLLGEVKHNTLKPDPSGGTQSQLALFFVPLFDGGQNPSLAARPSLGTRDQHTRLGAG